MNENPAVLCASPEWAEHLEYEQPPQPAPPTNNVRGMADMGMTLPYLEPLAPWKPCERRISQALGMVEATGMMLPLWEDVLPNVTDEELAAAAERAAAQM